MVDHPMSFLIRPTCRQITISHQPFSHLFQSLNTAFSLQNIIIKSSTDHQIFWYLRFPNLFYLSNVQVFLKKENNISPFEAGV